MDTLTDINSLIASVFSGTGISETPIPPSQPNGDVPQPRNLSLPSPSDRRDEPPADVILAEVSRFLDNPNGNSIYRQVLLEPKEKVAFPGTTIYNTPINDNEKRALAMAVTAINGTSHQAGKKAVIR